MLRFSFTPKEALFLLYVLELHLPDSDPMDSDTIDSVLEKLQVHSLTAPFKTATESRAFSL